MVRPRTGSAAAAGRPADAPGACDPAGDPLGFATALREQRLAAGFSQAELARRVHYDKSHISKVENGDKPATADFARACDRALRADGALLGLATQGLCPYPGLAAFGAADERWFHGRARARAELLGLLTDRCADRGGPVLVVGPSGAGKSSLLRAGLAPALRRGDLAGTGPTAPAVLTPTARPLEQLDSPAAERAAVWIVDQAEELFTVCADAGQRQAFLDRLCHEAGPDGGRLVVLGLRADLYGHCLAHDGLLRAVRHGQLALGPMTAGELAEAITAPARSARLELEPGLLDVLLTDLGLAGGDGRTAPGAPQAPPAGYDPGALPLLAHTLRAVWQQRTGRSLTLAGYRAIGGLRGSVAATAERAWHRLDGPGRVIARRVLLRLVHLGPDGQCARRRVTRERLLTAGTDPHALERVLGSFAADRLITLDADGVTLSHEALLRAWPRLRGWIEDGRAGLRLHQQLAHDAEGWAEAERDPALLYRGSRLELAGQWAADDSAPDDSAPDPLLTPVEREFLAASAERARQERAAERRRVRTLRRLAGALAVLLVSALLAGSFGWYQRNAALTADRASQARALVADAERNTARDPYATMLQAVQARRLAPETQPDLRRQAEDAVLGTQAQYLAGRIDGFEWGVNALALSPDGRLLATGDSQGRVALWDARTTAPVAELLEHIGAPVQDLRFSPDGTVLAAAITRDPEARRILLWNVAERRPLPSPVLPASTTGKASVAKRLAFSADGTLLAAGSSDGDLPGRLWVWRVGVAEPPLRTLTDQQGVIQCLAFGPGHRLASASTDGTVLVRDLDASPAGDGAPPPPVFSGRVRDPRSLVYAADGALLAVGDGRGGIRIWHPSTGGGAEGTELTVPGPGRAHTGPVNALGLTPDGATLVSAGDDQSARVWDLATARVTAELRGHPTFVLGLAVGGDNRTVVTSAGVGRPTGSVLLWDLRRLPDLAPGPGRPPVTAVATGGGRAAVGTADGRTALWELGGERRPVSVSPASGRPVTALALDRSGRLLAGAEEDGTVRIRRASDGVVQEVWTAGARVTALDLSPDGTRLAVGTADGTLLTGPTDGTPARPRLHTACGAVHAVAFVGPATVAFACDARAVQLIPADGDEPARRSATMKHDDYLRRIAVSQDGTRIATYADDRTIRVWDARTEQPLHPEAFTVGSDTVRALAFSPDGRTLADAGEHGEVRLWDPLIPDGPRRTLSSPGGPLDALAFLPDGRSVLAGGGNGAAPVWSLDPAEAEASACAVLRPPLRRSEWTRLAPGTPYRATCP